MALQQAAPASYTHVIADDEASPSPKRWRRGDTPADPDWSASSISEAPPKMVCCCFSSSPMPRCCLVAATSASPSSLPSQCEEEWRAFCTAARVTRRIGTSLIQRQAASINRQLLSSQQELVRSSQDDEVPSNNKRRRMAPDEMTSMPPNDPAHPDSPSMSSRVSTVTAASQAATDHASRIWQQVDRMKRMSLFLKNAQLAQSLLLEEMKEYYQAEAEASSSDRPYPPMEEAYEEEGANYDAASHQDPQNNEEY